MNIDEYQKLAILTESKIDKVVVDPIMLVGIIQAIVSASQMLDQVKRHVFYDKDYDSETMRQQLVCLINSIEEIKPGIVHIIDTNRGNNEAKLTQRPEEEEIDVNPRVFHSIIGLVTEAAELLEALDLTGESLDVVNIGEEIGDIYWYLSIATDELNLSSSDIMHTNIEKLKVRYPEGFSADDASERDLTAEREVLEQNK